jgi:hypothetical protein
MAPDPRLAVPEDTLVVEEHGPGEWIIGAPGDGRPLHVYRVAHGDWLVSEVGRRSEGRGTDLHRALAALAALVPPQPWWDGVVAALSPPRWRSET